MTPLIVTGPCPINWGDLVVVQDGDNWTFAVLDTLDGDTGWAWTDDRPLPFVIGRDVVVVRGAFSPAAGTLVGRRFDSPEAAGVELERFRRDGGATC